MCTDAITLWRVSRQTHRKLNLSGRNSQQGRNPSIIGDVQLSCLIMEIKRFMEVDQSDPNLDPDLHNLWKLNSFSCSSLQLKPLATFFSGPSKLCFSPPQDPILVPFSQAAMKLSGPNFDDLCGGKHVQACSRAQKSDVPLWCGKAFDPKRRARCLRKAALEKTLPKPFMVLSQCSCCRDQGRISFRIAR